MDHIGAVYQPQTGLYKLDKYGSNNSVIITTAELIKSRTHYSKYSALEGLVKFQLRKSIVDIFLI